MAFRFYGRNIIPAYNQAARFGEIRNAPLFFDAAKIKQRTFAPTTGTDFLRRLEHLFLGRRH
jgi:hypothetical protein